MNRSRKLRSVLALIGPFVFAAAVVGLAAWYLHDRNVAVLHPAGEIGQKERQLIDLAVILSVVVVLPVFALAILIAWKYRETNPRPKKYQPDWDHSRKLESIWWGVPGVIIVFLSVVTWVSSHSLDPYRSLESNKKPLRVQVVAMDWKWLFIYPDLHVASVNEVHVPVDTPINFQITSDSVMNSFWIPSLGSQIYAMPGMSTQLHLVANKAGSYYGTPANISGKGFARMTFKVVASNTMSFDKWLASAQSSNDNLSMADYSLLAKPSLNNRVKDYSPVQDDLYDEIVMKYMSHMQHESADVSTNTMHMGAH